MTVNRMVSCQLIPVCQPNLPAIASYGRRFRVAVIVGPNAQRGPVLGSASGADLEMRFYLNVRDEEKLTYMPPSITSQTTMIFVLRILSLFVSVNGLAITSRSKAAGGGGGGFGASKTAWKTYTEDDSPTTARLVDFLKQQQAEIDQVDVGLAPATNRRGLFATSTIGKDKIICKVPSDCALALGDPAQMGADAETVAEAAANFLTMYWNRPEARELWAPYLDTLPSEPGLDATPDFMSDDEIALLEFPRLVDRVRQRKQEIQAVVDKTGLSYDDVQYATWLVSSRSFPIQLSTSDTANTEADVLRDERGQVMIKAEDRKFIQVMVPLIDLANHDSDEPNAALTLIDPEKDDAWFALKALRPIKPGKEIVIAYGSGVQSSVELLSNYGFVPTRNRIDSLMLQKGGEGVLAKDHWTTTLEEDQSMLEMLPDDDSSETANLRKILSFRIKLKSAY